jgi:hypothetical protein
VAYSKRQVRETEVHRDPRTGRYTRTPAGKRAITALKALGRKLAAGQDRTGQRLRVGQKATDGWWYIPDGSTAVEEIRRRGRQTGAPYWVRRTKEPRMIGQYWYRTDFWGPVVPPREHWTSRDQYHGIPKQTPLSSQVPDDVWRAAQADAIYTRDSSDPSARSESFGRRQRRSGTHPDYPTRARGLKVTSVKKKSR